MKRVLTALALIPIVVYVVLWANVWIFLAVLFAVSYLCYREYDSIAAALRLRRARNRGRGRRLPAVRVAWRGVAISHYPHDRRPDRRNAHGRPREDAAARRPSDHRRDLHLRLLEMRDPAARGEPALADVRADAQLGGRYRSVLRRPQIRKAQAGAARQPEEVMGGRGGFGRHRRADRRRLPACDSSPALRSRMPSRSPWPPASQASSAISRNPP